MSDMHDTHKFDTLSLLAGLSEADTAQYSLEDILSEYRDPNAKKPEAPLPEPELKPEEQVRHLRSTVRWLGILLTVALLAFAFAANVLLYYLNHQDPGQEIGKNYTTQQEK